jgi:hypothetical protein
VHFTVIADGGVTGMYLQNSAVVIVGPGTGENIVNLVIPGVGMLADLPARCENYPIEHSAFAVKLCVIVGNFMHFRFAVPTADAFEFYNLFLSGSYHDDSPF